MGHKSIGTHQIELCVNGDNATYFDSFQVECIPKVHRQQKYHNNDL